MKRKIFPVVGLGAGGHAKVMIEALKAAGGYRIVGMLDPREELRNTDLLGIPILGGDELLAEFYQKKVRRAFMGVGAPRDLVTRKKVYEKAIRQGFQVINVIHPKAIISSFSDIGSAASIMAGAVIDPGVCLGKNTLINVGSYIGHDSVIGDHVHIAPHAVLGSGVQVGESSFVGLGAVIRPGVHIGRRTMIGMGAVVTKDVPDQVVVTGVPAKIIREN